ncbi:MAG: outer membrane protein assembly factor BamB family protein [Planctomycetota bacterium]|jgi:outer membrane protein assembly factor BamB
MHHGEKLWGAFAALVFAMHWSAAGPSAAGDWPTYRHDGHRSGVCDEDLAPPFSERWVYRPSLPPRPAWPEAPAKRDVYRRVRLGPTVVYDRAFHVVVQGGMLYFGSSADDTVYCLDAATGDTRWSFCTEGPVRLAPAAAAGRVYAGSDDGRLYCLDAAEGTLLWKYRPGPADRRLPGNGRMISLWPIRCGVAVDEGVAYVCAGLFPSQGAYLCAVDAQDGRELWKQPVDVSAQGFMLASPSRLYVPTGRTPPHVYRRSDGRQIAAFPGAGQQRSGTPEGGGCFAVLADDQLLHAAGEKGGIQVTGAASREKIVATSGLRVVVQGPVAYVLHHDRLTAVDRKLHVELAQLKQKKEKSPEDERRIGRLESTHLRWEVACRPSYELILAGETIFTGGENQIVAFRATDGRPLWTGKVDGKAYSLAVSDGRLFAGTDRGTIHCFAEGTALRGLPERKTGVAEIAGDEPSPPYPEDSLAPRCRRAAEAAIEAVQCPRGYCLVLGAGTGRLAYEVAKRSELRVIGVEPDAAKVADARRRLRKAGLYGSRVVIHHGRLDKLPYQKRIANLILSEDTLAAGKLPPSAAEVYRLLRPSGGAVHFVRSESETSPRALAAWGDGKIPGWSVGKNEHGQRIGVAVRGPLPGAGEWTHFYADAGNSACSYDALEPGPVDVQWFGRPGPRRMVDRHEKNVGPLFKNGRLFVSGDNYLAALDAYNGTVLWERDLPDSIRLGAFKNCGSMAATDEFLYVAAGDRCIALDVASGETKLSIPVPEAVHADECEWGYVAAVGDAVFGSVTKPGATFRVQDVATQTLIWRDFQPVVTSDAVFAVNRHDGTVLWTRAPEEGVVVNPTIAVGDGRIYWIESTNPDARDAPDGRITLDVLLGEGSALVALDAETGEVAWRRRVDLRALQHMVFLTYASETLVVTGTKNVPFDDKPRVRYDLWAFDAATGNVLWQTTQTPVPDHILDGPHGEQVQHSAVVGDCIYNTGFALGLRTGEPAAGWKWQKSDKCGVLSTSASCAFSRFSSPRMFDLNSGQYTALTQVTRPGCWINIIPAGGLVLIPEASSGCTCDYSIQTSLALTPRDGRP